MRGRPQIRLVIALGAVLGAAGTASALAAPTAVRAGTGTGSSPVTAVVVVRPGVALPLAVPGGRVVRLFRHVGSELVRMPASDYAALAADPRVAGVSPDRAGRVSGKADAPAATPGVYASQYLGGDSSTAGYGVNVALLDTGVSDTPALNRASGRITDGVDVSTLDSTGASTDGTFTDGYGHGTFLASLIAGGPVPGSDGHPLGVAPAARIVVVKVADSNGNTSLAKVLAGMDWVAAHAQGIQVLNVALAINRPTAPAYGADPLTTAVDHVRDSGVLVVAAAGNQRGQLGDPGMDPRALTVGAADLSGPGAARVASFSGSGVVAGVSKPDVVASGVDLLGLLPVDSTISRQHPTAWQANGLFRGSGTSESTAVVSGVAAAYLSQHPGTSVADVKTAIRTAASNLPGTDRASGAGLVQLPGGPGGTSPSSGKGKNGNDPTGEASFDQASWQANAWQAPGGFDWQTWLANHWSAPAWDASSWSASSWSASSWSASSWSASSWSASSWSASSWSASSWSASSWSASSWSDYSWGGS